ncbi:MAG: hypothetical protein H7Z41_01775 [Cytophagales bacterium]|nr:hypothetical protein [Armatimonadota bacterium]
MKIVIKPLGAVVLLGAILLLAVLAFRGKPWSDLAVATAPVVVSNTTPGTAVASSLAGAPSADAPSLPRIASSSGPIRGHSIYRDGVENGWETQGWTWAKEVVFDDSTLVRSGSKAIKVQYQAYDGVKFHHAPLNTTSFNRISFYINGGTRGGQRIAVGAACSEKNVADGVRFAALPAGKWVAVTIPLSKISLADRPDMTSFWIQGSSDKPQPAVFLDEVRLLRPSEPAPSGDTLALAQ